MVDKVEVLNFLNNFLFQLNGIFDSVLLAEKLANATNRHCDMSGKNLELAIGSLKKLTDYELRANYSSSHIV